MKEIDKFKIQIYLSFIISVCCYSVDGAVEKLENTYGQYYILFSINFYLPRCLFLINYYYKYNKLFLHTCVVVFIIKINA